MRIGLNLAVVLAACAAAAAEPEPARDVYGDSLPAGAVARLGTSRLDPGLQLTGLAFAGRDRIVSLDNSSGSHEIQLWQVDGGKPGRTIQGSGHGMSLAVTPDGATAAVSVNSNKILLYDLTNGKQVHEFSVRNASATFVSFGSEGKMLLAVGYRGATLWDWTTRKEIRSVDQQGYGGAISPDGKRIAIATFHYGKADEAGGIVVFDVETGKQQYTIKRSGNNRYSWVGFSGDGNWLIGSSMGTSSDVDVWEAATGKKHTTLKGHTAYVSRCAPAPAASTLATASHDRSVRLWDLKTGKQLWSATTGSPQNQIDISPDGRLVASGGGLGGIRIWKTADGDELGADRPHHGPVRSIDFSSDGKQMLSSDLSGVTVLWDLQTARPLRRVLRRDTSVETVRFLGDGKGLVFDAGGNGLIVNLATGDTVTSLNLGSYPSAAGTLDRGRAIFALSGTGSRAARRRAARSVRAGGPMSGRREPSRPTDAGWPPGRRQGWN